MNSNGTERKRTAKAKRRRELLRKRNAKQGLAMVRKSGELKSLGIAK